MVATKLLFYYSFILLSLVLYCFIILCIRLIGSYLRWSCWGYALGTLLLRSMPAQCTHCHGPYEGRILGLAGVACAMLGAGGIRSHLNAWDNYHIFKKVHSIYLTFFLIAFLFLYCIYCLNCKINVISLMMSLSFCNIYCV